MKLRQGDRVRISKILAYPDQHESALLRIMESTLREGLATDLEKAGLAIGDETEITAVFTDGYVVIEGWLHIPADCLEKVK